MDLREYLFRHRIKYKDFAAKIGYTPNYISMIVHDRVIPVPRPFASMVEKATNGEVKL